MNNNEIERRLKIGKEVYELLLDNKNLNIYEVCSDKAYQYNLTWSQVYKAYMEYRKRETIFGESKSGQVIVRGGKIGLYYYNKDIINSVSNIKNNEDMEFILKRFEWSVVQESVNNYIKLPQISYEDKQVIQDNYNRLKMFKKRPKQNEVKTKDFEERVISTINDYLNSNDVFIDDILHYYYGFNNYSLFTKNLENLKDIDLYRTNYYEPYFRECSNRLALFIMGSRFIINKYEDKTLKAIDISLYTGLSLKQFISAIRRDDVIKYLGKNRSYIFKFVNYLNANFNKHELSDDEVKSFSYNNNGVSIQDYTTDIMKVFNRRGIIPTKNNLIDAFNMIVNNPDEFNKIASLSKETIANLRTIIAKYCLSDDVVEDYSLFYKNVDSYESSMETLSNLDVANKAWYSVFKKVKDKRIEDFTYNLNQIMVNYPNLEDLSLVKICYILNLNIDTIIKLLSNDNVINNIDSNWVLKFKSFITKSINARLITIEEAEAINYSYKGHNLSNEDLLETINSLSTRGIPLTLPNITETFKLKVERELEKEQELTQLNKI